MANIPLALVGAVLGLWLSGQPLSVAALVNFITLRPAFRYCNGILRSATTVNLMRMEGENFDHQDDPAWLAGTSFSCLDDGVGDGLRAGAAVVRGRNDLARNPSSSRRGHFLRVNGGSALLDTFLTPAMFWLFGLGRGTP